MYLLAQKQAKSFLHSSDSSLDKNDSETWSWCTLSLIPSKHVMRRFIEPSLFEAISADFCSSQAPFHPCILPIASATAYDGVIVSNESTVSALTVCIQVTFLAVNFRLKSSKRAWNNVISLVLRSYTKISSSNSVCKVIPESS